LHPFETGLHALLPRNRYLLFGERCSTKKPGLYRVAWFGKIRTILGSMCVAD
jgi:hypothetical protein